MTDSQASQNNSCIIAPYLSAETPSELIKKLELETKYLGQQAKHQSIMTDSEWYERQQMRALLKAFASSSFLQFPFEVTHTPKRRPDFKLKSSNRTIGIEASRITNEELHRAEVLKRNGRTSPVTSPSSSLVAGKRRNNDELAIAISLPSGLDWNSPSDEDEYWHRCACQIIERKSNILKAPDFIRVDETWLLLTDYLSNSVIEMQKRSAILRSRLTQRLNQPDWFNKIIIAFASENEKERFVLITATQTEHV